jgi:hypothetical protein
MKRRYFAFTAAVALMACAFAVRTGAQSWGQLEKITFSQAVALPGVVLPAGAYTFEIATPNSSANVVRVIHRDTHQVYFAAFTERVRRPGNLRPGQRMTFGEAVAGEAVPINVWYPGAGAEGHRFLYR